MSQQANYQSAEHGFDGSIISMLVISWIVLYLIHLL